MVNSCLFNYVMTSKKWIKELFLYLMLVYNNKWNILLSSARFTSYFHVFCVLTCLRNGMPGPTWESSKKYISGDSMETNNNKSDFIDQKY